jgi:hypothetical protein
MKLLFTIIGFIVHISLSAIAIDLIGSFMSENNNILIILGDGLLIFIILATIVYHTKHVIKVFKTQI